MLLDAFDSGWISSTGRYVSQFQQNFARYVGAGAGVATSSGTTALHLALSACGIKEGDEVVVPDLTFVSPANMVTLVGAKAVMADSNRAYWGVDADAIKRRLTKRTKAIIVVHLYGHPVDLDPISELCESENLTLIEDCAEAHGARYRGKKVGSFGRVSCFSFYGNKLLTTGEGGMCLTDDSVLAEKLILLRDHGADRRKHFWHPVVGFNYRMTNLQAAIGCAQLQSLDDRVSRYRKIGKAYEDNLKDVLGSQVSPHPHMDWAYCVFWMYTILIDGLGRRLRGNLQRYLETKGIETRPMFYPVSKLPPFRDHAYTNRVANELSERGLSLPTYEGLDDNGIAFISRTLRDFARGWIRK
jgi:perosamine synthetase